MNKKKKNPKKTDASQALPSSVDQTNKKLIFVLVVFLAAVSVGLVAVCYNKIFIWGTDVARNRFLYHPALLFIAVPAFFLFSAWLCRKFAPNAAGGGPDHVIAAMQKLGSQEKQASVNEFLSLRILIVKVISSVFCIMGGGALGREGPVVQISASIFVFVAQKTKRVLPHFDLRTWIIAGSSAGLAAAFNTPLAGIIFAIEELSQFHFEKQFSEFRSKAFFAVIVAGLTAQLITGSYVLFEFPEMHFIWQTKIALVLIAVSAICGVCAFLLSQYIKRTTSWRNSVTGKMWYLFPIVTGLIVATVSFNMGTNTFGAGMYTIQESLRSSVSVISLEDSIGRFINIIATAASGCAGGLLLPALALGAGIGSLGSTVLPDTDARLLVASGMAAFLGAMLNAPLTAAVLVLEVTSQRELIFPLFLSTIIACWIRQHCGRIVNKVAH